MGVGIEGLDDILLVEDNPGDIRLIEEAFRDSSLDPAIHTTRSREEALEFLDRGGESEDVPRPDLVLLDWNLSQNTGAEVIEAAKSVQPAVPVVVMTGSRSALQCVESSPAPADEYIEKRTDPQDYIDILRSCLPEQ